MKNLKCMVVSGKSNVGKTSALKELIRIFESKYEKMLFESYGKRMTNDVMAAFLINGYKVGIITQGDAAWCVNKGLNKIGDCDFIFGASHLFGSTVDEYFKHFETNEILFMNKLPSKDASLIEDDNKNYASMLEELVTLLLSSKRA